jgi:hypothetical protein
MANINKDSTKALHGADIAIQNQCLCGRNVCVCPLTRAQLSIADSRFWVPKTCIVRKRYQEAITLKAPAHIFVRSGDEQ